MKTDNFLIETTYAEATSGIKEEWFLNSNTDWYIYVEALPKRLQITYLVTVLHNQVMNGTFDQYFANGYGLLFSNLTAQAFLEINAQQKSIFIKQAVNIISRKANSIGLAWGIKGISVKDLLFVLNDVEVSAELENISDAYYSDEEDVADLLSNYLLRSQ